MYSSLEKFNGSFITCALEYIERVSNETRDKQ